LRARSTDRRCPNDAGGRAVSGAGARLPAPRGGAYTQPPADPSSRRERGESMATTTQPGTVPGTAPGPATTAGAPGAPPPAPPLPPVAPLRPGSVPQTFYNPTRIIYSEGAAGQIGPHAARLGAKKAMVVSDAGVVRAGMTRPVAASLEGAGLGVAVYDAVEPDPRIELVERALETYHGEGCDLLVAVGGGGARGSAEGPALPATQP